MLKFLPYNTLINTTVVVGAVLALSACSSHNQTPVMAQFQPQYCHTKSNYTLDNGNTASSRIDVNCTDDPNDKHFLAYSGMAKKWREHYYNVWYHGKQQKQRGFVCQKLDGSWEVLNHPYN